VGLQAHSVIALALLLVLSGCKEKPEPSDDAGQEEIEDVLDDETLEEVPEEPAEDVLEEEDVELDAEDVLDVDDVSDDAPDDSGDEDAGEEDVAGDAEEDAILFGCGNGIVEPLLGEVCDDGNTDRETCGTTDPAACLADCSVLMASCPGGVADPGEQCDDGDTDTMNACTTSCTVNFQSIGSPCQCTSGCDVLDFTAGTIVGCDSAIPYADENRTLACVRSSRDSAHGVAVHAASGFCTLLAVGCTGTLCHMVPTTGDVDLFTCPPGSAVLTEMRTMMGMIITARSCHPLCWTDADCRWNAVEDGSSPWSGSCGAYECLPLGAGGQSICVDPRNST
jgi:hypothetical protein